MRLYHRFDPSWVGDAKVLGMKGFGFVVQAEKHNAKLVCNGRNWFASEMQWFASVAVRPREGVLDRSR